MSALLSHYKFANLYQIALDGALMELFLSTLMSNPKPKNMTKSVYMVYLAIQMLENMGNIFPSQKEISAMELIIKRYSNRKSSKDIFNKSCLCAN